MVHSEFNEGLVKIRSTQWPTSMSPTAPVVKYLEPRRRADSQQHLERYRSHGQRRLRPSLLKVAGGTLRNRSHKKVKCCSCEHVHRCSKRPSRYLMREFLPPTTSFTCAGICLISRLSSK